MAEPKPAAHHRRMAFIGLCLVCVTVGGGYFFYARHRSLLPETPELNVPAAPAPRPQSPVAARPERRILFCSTSVGAHQGRLATVDLSGPGKGEIHFHDSLSCRRVDFRGGSGICLRVNLNSPMMANEAVIFDKAFRIQHIIPLAGALSRTRVSPNGKWGAVTVFTGGGSYASTAMSTKTTLMDMPTGTVKLDLEDLVVRNKGAVIKQPDFNFWGVTFTKDSRSFYATLSTGGKIYLIKASLDTFQADVICENVECPSLSPDNTRIAFKKRSTLNGRVIWHLAVLNLATLKETLLPEPAPIDQQVQWYDNRHVMYAIPQLIVGQPVIMYTWIIAADGSRPPERLLSDADSPVLLQ